MEKVKQIINSYKNWAANNPIKNGFVVGFVIGFVVGIIL